MSCEGLPQRLSLCLVFRVLGFRALGVFIGFGLDFPRATVKLLLRVHVAACWAYGLGPFRVAVGVARVHDVGYCHCLRTASWHVEEPNCHTRCGRPNAELLEQCPCNCNAGARWLPKSTCCILIFGKLQPTRQLVSATPAIRLSVVSGNNAFVQVRKFPHPGESKTTPVAPPKAFNMRRIWHGA